jgi:hypothetical protein
MTIRKVKIFDSNYMVREQLIKMIKSKYENLEGIEYDSRLTDFHLIKGDSGFFTIEIPTT